MRKHKLLNRIGGCAVALGLFLLAACSGAAEEPRTEQGAKTAIPGGPSRAPVSPVVSTSATPASPTPMPPTIADADWAPWFEGLTGAAVVYSPAQNHYDIYNRDLAQTRRSPCSTFKIISSLVAMESGQLRPEESTRAWSGEQFWNEEWNRDLDFDEAFRTSCVWYFRQLIDEIGPERMETALVELEYGNADISDWEGRLNTNNQNRALTGFWIESSLRISPQEQVAVLARIFEPGSAYDGETLATLRRVMRGWEQGNMVVYGKTGMGKAEGVTVDAWYAGFAEKDGERRYFCVYLGETKGAEVSSTKAREIAHRILAAEDN